MNYSVAYENLPEETEENRVTILYVLLCRSDDDTRRKATVMCFMGFYVLPIRSKKGVSLATNPIKPSRKLPEIRPKWKGRRKYKMILIL
jgi:hypothetical protein